MVKIANKSFEALPEPADYWKWVAEGRFDHEWRAYGQYLKPQHVFVDLGAWIGSHSMYASTITKRILSVEPDPVAFKILEANLGFLDPRPFTYELAITAEDGGFVTLGSELLGASTTRRNLAAGGGIGAAVEGQTVNVWAKSLRSLVSDYEAPLFVKIDVEGSEEEIFKDLAFFAERKPTMLVELHPFWWKDEQQTWKDFEAIKAFYSVAFEVPHPNSRMWILEKGEHA